MRISPLKLENAGAVHESQTAPRNMTHHFRCKQDLYNKKLTDRMLQITLKEEVQVYCLWTSSAI